MSFSCNFLSQFLSAISHSILSPGRSSGPSALVSGLLRLLPPSSRRRRVLSHSLHVMMRADGRDVDRAAGAALARELSAALEPLSSKHLAELLTQCRQELEKGERVKNAAWLDVMAHVSPNDCNTRRQKSFCLLRFSLSC